ncbi:MAG: Asp-tRNA(Asn)/Glu-tRNA(Gln) amidotransferase subunit GatA [Clostridia bacterium]|nr:Asp-tRNA(Asn)/Glu-tRNA(Gln) amidotransferase subunit GatA [Clostridia bacterium]
MKDILKLTVTELSLKLAKRELSSKEVTEAYLRQIADRDERIGAYITVCDGEAIDSAERVDAKRAEGDKLSPLAGIPVGIKDNICTRGLRTTCASRMLKAFVPPYDATVVERLHALGTVTLGKLNMDEFAMGSTTESSYFKKTRNPRSIEYVPGGSSGGSAAAVAADEAPFSLGSDTGGSIRQPASFCGVVGMKPTYGSVSRYGLIAFASSLDQIGPMTKNVCDNALVLNAITGHDRRDATSVSREYGDFTEELALGVKGMKLGLPDEFFGEGINGEVKEAVLGAAKVYERMGAEIVPVSIKMLDYALPAYYVISSAEASSNLARFDGVRYGYRSESYSDITELYKNSRSEGFGTEVKRRIMLGTFALSSGYYDAYYKKALQVRTLVMNDFARVFERCDCILAPVSPTTAYKLGEKSASPLEMYMGDIYTVPVNIAGIPSLSLPCGTDKKGLPIGMQLIGKAFSEATLYRVGNAYETECGVYHLLREGEQYEAY